MIFVDSSFWIAAAIDADAHHDEAAELVSRFAGDRLVTTNHVCGETWTFIRRRFGHRQAVAVIDRLERTPRLERHSIGAEIEGEAWTWLRRRDERPYSFVDATSFALMRSLRIREALAFDADFSAAGFVELRA
jgi:predicted nucleic acid-binding protein